jgi:hypothetical protein
VRAARTPFMVRHRILVFVAWLVLAVVAAPFAARVTHHLAATGFTAPNSTSVWADNQSALLHPPASTPPTLVQGLALARARRLAVRSGVPEGALHPLSGGAVLVLPPVGHGTQARVLLAGLRAAGARTTSLEPASLGQEINRDSKDTLQHATALALPVLLVLLILVFGSVGSAVLPLVVALFGAVARPIATAESPGVLAATAGRPSRAPK